MMMYNYVIYIMEISVNHTDALHHCRTSL